MLTNLLRYAAGTAAGSSAPAKAATRVAVLVQRRRSSGRDEILTVVEDNGPGFDVEAVLNQPSRKRRLGIFGMQERARLAGETLDIVSTLGEGTSVYLRLPLAR